MEIPAAIRGRFPSDFPECLFREARSLGDIGVTSVAWRFPVVLQVVDLLAQEQYALLGGDVYEDRGGGEITILGDNWSCNRAITGLVQPWDEYVRVAKETAFRYIKTYHDRKGDAYWYDLVLLDEQSFNDRFGVSLQ